MQKENISEIRKKPGESNAGKYVGTKAGQSYAGPDKTFPIGDLKHARSALSYAHNASNPSAIKEKVYSKFPGLKERHNEKNHEKIKGDNEKKKFDAYKSR